MEKIKINEIIDVGAVFSKDRIKPKWFVWKKRKYAVKETTYTWKDRAGEAILIHFSVSDGATLFELCFNQKSLEWKLENVDAS